MTALPQNPTGGLQKHFAGLLQQLGADETVCHVAAELVEAMQAGDVAFDLRGFCETRGIGFQNLRDTLLGSAVAGKPEDDAPLVLEAGRLYTRRLYQYEQNVAQRLCSAGYEGPRPEGEDGQARAVALAPRSRLLVVTGGPGTGKTTVAARIIAELARDAGETFQLQLAAPTGKAAARLQQAIRAELDKISVPDAVRSVIPQNATTIHRMLGALGQGSRFRRNRDNPLLADAVLIDEASMIALPLMAKLLDALPEQTRLILLGDSDQLASVDAGAVFGDITTAAMQPGSPLENNLVRLEKNWRFTDESGIFRLSAAVRNGLATEVAGYFETNPFADAHLRGLPPRSELARALEATALPKLLPLVDAKVPEEALGALHAFRVLCAVRSGACGVEGINDALISLLRKSGRLDPNRSLCHGMPILVLQNDPSVRLYNGDTGILLSDPANPAHLWAWFEGENGVPRRVTPARLPAWEPAFAMTVHKSQGSEFQNVLLILPEAINPVVTRELVYTGITRARNHVELWARPEILAAAIQTRQKRVSGLVEALTAPIKTGTAP